MRYFTMTNYAYATSHVKKYILKKLKYIKNEESKRRTKIYVTLSFYVFFQIRWFISNRKFRFIGTLTDIYFKCTKQWRKADIGYSASGIFVCWIDDVKTADKLLYSF